MQLLSPVDEATDLVSRDYYDKRTFTKVKTANKSVSSNITPADDDHLVFTDLEINTNYTLDGVLFMSGITAGDLRITWSVPSGAVVRVQTIGLQVSATAVAAQIPAFGAWDTATEMWIGTITGADTAATMRGFLAMSSNTGTFALKWSQVTSNGTATVLQKGSFIRLRKM